MPTPAPSDRIECKACESMILTATAERTGGYCMPCAKVLDPDLEREIEDRKVPQNPTFQESAKGCGWILLLLPFFAFFSFIWKALIIAVIALIGHYIFGASWSSSLIAGVLIYLALGFIMATLDLPIFEKWFNKRALLKQENAKARKKE